MAAKNARIGDKRTPAGSDSADESAAIAALIAGDDTNAGIGAGNGSGGDDQDDTNASAANGRGRKADGATGTRASDGGADTGTGTGASGGRGSNSARSVGGASSPAGEEKKPVRATTAKLAPPKKTRGVVEEEAVTLPDSSRELIGDFYSVLYWIAAEVTQVPEWRLSDDDAELLGDKTEKFVKSLGKRRTANLLKSLGKVGPALGFAGAVAMVTVPRVKLTMRRTEEATNAKPIPAANNNGNGRSGPAAIATNTDSASDKSVVDGDRTDGPGLSERSFTARDFDEVVPGYRSEDAGRNIS